MLDYSECSTRAPEGDGLNAFATMPGDKVSTSFKKSNNTNQEPPRWKRNTTDVEYAPGVRVSTNVCSLLFHIPNDIGPPVLMFYRLTNFYQNHRRYVKSLDQEQLRGTAKSNASIDDSCTPLRHNSSGFAYYPCGLIANSLFNDTIMTPQLVNVGNGNEANRTYEMTDRGIAWGSDRSLYGPTAYSWDQVAPPPNWERRYPGGYTPDNKPPNLQEDEAFQVWMRTAGLPTFSKLARRNDGEVMTRGTYRVDIRDSMQTGSYRRFHVEPGGALLILLRADFPVTVYGGTKSLVISTRTVMGGKNPFLGIAYIVVGGICVLLGALFTAIHLVKPRCVTGRFLVLLGLGSRELTSSVLRSLVGNWGITPICPGTTMHPLRRLLRPAETSGQVIIPTQLEDQCWIGHMSVREFQKGGVRSSQLVSWTIFTSLIDFC